jgi:NAD(P)H-hydrate repair Nnr-like enzyme with NAD(P)H-hydrate dehydratase domain
MHEFWLQQKIETPLFPDILWSRPENRQAAGKLLIVGGNMHGFIAVGKSYQDAVKAGAGTVHVLLPEALRKTVGSTLENCEYAPSNTSGGFARNALNELLTHAAWADCVLLAGDFGRNSETAIVLESFVQKYSGLLVITRDAIDYFYTHATSLLDRPNTCIVGTTAQIQKLATAIHFTRAITTGMDLVRLVETLHDFAGKHNAHIITQHLGTTIVAADGKISSTKTGDNEDIWRTKTAARASVFWMQNSNKSFEALTTLACT